MGGGVLMHVRNFTTYPDDLYTDFNRPLQLSRPCECGCDRRGVDNVGYLTWITRGAGVSILAESEAEYELLRQLRDAVYRERE